MKKVNFKRKYNIFLPLGNTKGFTLIEALVSMVILSVGILGLASSINSVTRYQNLSKDVTLATMHTTSKLEEIKRFATNEPTGGAFGFDYLVGDENDDFFALNGYANTDDRTRTASVVTADGYTVESVITIFPANAPQAENFTNPGAIRLVDAQVTTTWTDKSGNGQTVQSGTVLHRRQFVGGGS